PWVVLGGPVHNGLDSALPRRQVAYMAEPRRPDVALLETARPYGASETVLRCGQIGATVPGWEHGVAPRTSHPDPHGPARARWVIGTRNGTDMEGGRRRPVAVITRLDWSVKS